MKILLAIWFVGYLLSFIPLIYYFREEVFGGPFKEFLISIWVIIMLATLWPTVLVVAIWKRLKR